MMNPCDPNTQTSTYADFLASEAQRPTVTGIEPSTINPALFDFQAAIVRWAVRRGRAAIFADTGLGKTLMQVEWANQIGGPALIFAPLAVAEQTVGEA